MKEALTGGPLTIHWVADPFKADQRQSDMRPWRAGVTLQELAEERWGAGAVALAILPGDSARGRLVEPQDMGAVFAQPGQMLHLVQIPAGVEITLATVITQILVAAAVAAATFLLFPPPDAPTAVEEDTSKTYGWNGVQTNYKSAGSTIPRVYGYHGVGGLVISQEVQDVVQDQGTGPASVSATLKVLLALCEGPIKSVGGVTTTAQVAGDNLPEGLQINGNNAANLEGVKATVRLGTQDQEPIAGFTLTSTIYNVGLDVDNFDADGNVITGFTDATEFDMPEDGDEVTVRIGFPNGLFEVDGNGNSKALSTALRLRYQELDSSGTPFGPTVDVQGGADFTFTEAITSSFSRGIQVKLFDPDTYTAPTVGSAAIIRNTGGDGDSLESNLDLPNPTGTDDWSVELWRRPYYPSAAYPGEYLLSNGATTTGLIGNQAAAPTAMTPGGILVWTAFSSAHIHVSFVPTTGLSTQVQTINTGVSAGGLNEYQQLVITSGVNADGTAKRLRIFKNGQLVYTEEVALPTWSGPMRIGLPVGCPPTKAFYLGPTFGWQLNPTDGFNANLDSLRFFRRELASGPIASSWTQKTLDPVSDANAVLWHSFDAALSIETANIANTVSFSNSGNDRLFTCRINDPQPSWGSFYTGAEVINIDGYQPNVTWPGQGHNLLLDSVVAGAGFSTYTLRDVDGVLEHEAPTGSASSGGVMRRVDYSIAAEGDTTVTSKLICSNTTGPTTDGVLSSDAGNTIKRGKYRISVERATDQQDTTKKKGNTAFQSLSVGLDRGFTYPGVALMALEIPAQADASGGTPSVLVPVEGKLVDVRVGGTGSAPVLEQQYSSNPWRILPDLFLDERALGQFHQVGDFDWDEIEANADYSDELVSTGQNLLPLTGNISYGGATTVTSYQVQVPKGTASDGIISLVAGVSYLRVQGLGAALTGNGWPAENSLRLVLGVSDLTDLWVVTLSGIDGLTTAPGATADPLPTGGNNQAVPTDAFLSPTEPRHSVNIVFDRADDDVWSAITKVARAGRGSVVPFGSSIQMLQQRPATPVHVFNEANILKGSLTISGITPEEDFNAATVEILNEELTWERDPVSRQAEDLKQAVGFVREVRKAFKMEGVTSQGQAARELDVLLKSNAAFRSTISFEAWLDAITLKPGDVFHFSHQLPAWDIGGRVQSDASTESEVALDVDVTLDPAKTYRVAVRGPEGQVSSAVVLGPTGSVAAGTTLTLDGSLSHIPQTGDMVVLGEQITTTRLYRVNRIGLSPDFTRTISAVGYSEDVYTPSPVSLDNQAVNASEAIAPNALGPAVEPSSVTARENTTADQITGALDPGILVSWSFSAQDVQRVREVRIWARPMDGVGGDISLQRADPRLVATVPAAQGSYRATGAGIAIGSAVQVCVQPVTFGGAFLSPRALPMVEVSMQGRLERVEGVSTLSPNRYGRRALLMAPRDNGRAASFEVRQGGWILGMEVEAPEGGRGQIILEELADTTDNGVADGPIQITGRERLSSGEYAGTFISSATDGDFHDDGVDADVVGIRQEDFGFTAVPTGGTGAPTLSGLVETTPGGPLQIDPDSGTLNPSWTSSVFDTGEALRYRVNFALTAWQVHPATLEDLGEYEVDGLVAQDWSFEGPLFEPWDHPFTTNMLPQYQIRYANTSSPSGSWSRFRPGVYYGRSFQFRVIFRRFSTDFNVDYKQAGVRIFPMERSQAERVDGGTF